MHDFVNFVQIRQSAHDGERDLREYRLCNRADFLVDCIERSVDIINTHKMSET